MALRKMLRRTSPGAVRVLLCGSILLVAPSCSDSDNDATIAFDAIYAEIMTAADPLAARTAEAAVTALSSQASSESAAADVRSKHPTEVQAFKDRLCKALEQSAKKADDEALDTLRTTAEQSLRDSLILKFLQSATAASSEVQGKIVELVILQSKGEDGSPLTGSSALKDASISDAVGAVKIPPVGTAEYTQYTNWLRANPGLRGFVSTFTQDYERTIQDCTPG